MTLIFKWSLLMLLVLPFSAQGEPWGTHQKNMEVRKRKISKFEEELDALVEIKKKTRDQARIEESLQRIVEIHAELIGQRREMDQERRHVKSEHPEKITLFDSYDSRSTNAKKSKSRYRGSALSGDLDQLLIKVQVKFASFMKEEKTEAQEVVEKVVEKKQKERRERQADVYLRRRSKVKMSK